LAKVEKISTLEADLELLDEKVENLKLTGNQRFAVVYRSE
jgi:hypothetical protein